MTNRHMKRWSTVSVIWEIYMKETMKYHFPPTKMAITKRRVIITTTGKCL